MGSTEKKLERPYCVGDELTLFRQLREQGRLSIFKIARCLSCGCDIPRSKMWCSEECANKVKRNKGGEADAEQGNDSVAD